MDEAKRSRMRVRMALARFPGGVNSPTLARMHGGQLPTDEELFQILNELGDWVGAMVARNTQIEHERNELLAQRSAIRAFLGLPS